jgi:hypothetical protein
MAKKDDHWFKFYYRLILISCQGWRDDEFGAYVRLLIHQFDKDGLPENEAEIAKLITTFKKNWPMLKAKFKKCEDGLLRNDFMKEIRNERDEKSRRGVEIGKTGGRPKKNEPVINNKPKGFEKETHIDHSLSSSNSPSLVDEVSSKGEEGWNTFPDETQMDLWLPEITAGAVTELFGIAKRVDLTPDQVSGLWKIFKAQNFTGKKFYQSQSAVYSHFINWSKIQTVDNGNSNRASTSAGNGKPSGGKDSGANKLAGILQKQIESSGPG